MSLIRKSNELQIQTTVKMMIYGQAGMGKTTLALSAPKPLLLDFDNGVKRVNENHLNDSVGIVQVTCWQDVLNVLNEDLSDYQTIVVDTVGKMMDFIIAFKCGQKQPKVQDWTAIVLRAGRICAGTHRLESVGITPGIIVVKSCLQQTGGIS